MEKNNFSAVQPTTPTSRGGSSADCDGPQAGVGSTNPTGDIFLVSCTTVTIFASHELLVRGGTASKDTCTDWS